MIARCLVFAAVLLCGGCASVVPAFWSAPNDETYLADLHARGLFQGAVVYGRGGRVALSRGFGFADVERGIPFTPETPTDLGSISKTFTSAALLSLAAEWKVDLEAEVRKYLPEYPHAGTRVRHLLAHSAGLPSYGWLDARFPAGETRTNASHLAAIAREVPQPAFPPGTRFRYDNVAYDVAAMLVERVSGESYSDYLEERFWLPAGMVAFVRPARFAQWDGVRTRGYERRNGRMEPNDAVEGEGFHGAGNVYTSAKGLYRWARALPSLVQPEVLVLGMAPAPLDDGRRTGLGLLNWYVSPDRKRRYYIGHHNGFHNFIYADDEERIAVAYVSNDTLPSWMQVGLARALVAMAEGRDPVRLEPPAPSPVLTEVAGTYQVDGVGPVAVRSVGKRLVVGVAGVDYDAFPIEPGVHYVPGQDAYLRFEAPPGAPRRLRWDSVFLATSGPSR